MPRIKPSQLTKKCRNFKSTDPLAPKIVRTKKNGHGNGILKIPEMKDSEGKEYIPFCNFSWHTGILLDNVESCINKRCSHYRIGYVEKPNFSKIPLLKYKN